MQKEQNGLISSQEQNIIASALLLGYNDFYVKSKQNKFDKQNPFSIMVYLSSKASVRPVPAKGFPYVVVNRGAIDQFYFNEFVRSWAEKIYNYMSKVDSLNARTCYQGNLKEILYDVFNDKKTADLSKKLVENLLNNNQAIELTDLTYMLANQQKVCKILDENLAKKVSTFLLNQEASYLKNDKVIELQDKAKKVAKTLGKGQIINNKLCYKDAANELENLSKGVSGFLNR